MAKTLRIDAKEDRIRVFLDGHELEDLLDYKISGDRCTYPVFTFSVSVIDDVELNFCETDNEPK